MHNDTVNNFLNRNGINEDDVRSKVNTRIVSIGEINPIFEDFGIYKSGEEKRISIGDIYGFDYAWRGVFPDAFRGLDSFYDEYGDGYHSRSCAALEMTAYDMLKSDSFEEEAIKVISLDEDSPCYLVESNGLHRYMALRALYLKDISDSPDKENEIKDKYKIKVVSSSIDKTKTYCNFIIASTMKGAYLKNQYDDSYHTTGNSILVTSEGNRVLTDEELVDFTRGVLSNNPGLIDGYRDNSDFVEFVDSVIYSPKNKEVKNG